MLDENTNEKLDKLEKKILNIEKNHNEILNSYNHLFNIIFRDCEIKPKGILKYTQILSQQLLDFVVNVCNKYGLNYWIDYGNLLGAVRHGGFIPWDDDMDIGMMRKDYEKFLEIIEYELEIHDLKEDMRVQKLNLNYHVLFTQLFYSPQKTNGIYAGLDIFPYDFIEHYDEDIIKKFAALRSEYKKDLGNGIPKEDAIKKYFKTLNVSLDKTNYVISGIDSVRSPYARHKLKVLDANKIFPLETIEFNNKTYTCPRNTDYHLTEIYGEWKSIPKIIHKHERLAKLKNSDENIEETFKTAIAKLKHVNSLF